jgi:high mobility group protein 20A
MDEQISTASLIENLDEFSGTKTDQGPPLDEQSNKAVNEFQAPISTQIQLENVHQSENFINNINDQSNVNYQEEHNTENVTNLDSKQSNQISDINFLTNTDEIETFTKKQPPHSNDTQFANNKSEEPLVATKVAEDTTMNSSENSVQMNEIEISNHTKATNDEANQNVTIETQLVTDLKVDNTLNEVKHDSNSEPNETSVNVEMNCDESNTNEKNVAENKQIESSSSSAQVLSNLENSIMTVSNEQNVDDSNDAVAAVVAAVEQSVAAKAVTGNEVNGKTTTATPKSVKKKARTSSPNKPTTGNQSSTVNNHLTNGSLNNSMNNDSMNNNTSPNSAQKRRKKDPHAPKAPLNGYLVYFNEERAEMRSKNPQMSFGELTKIIAAKWKDLPVEDKQKYINEADVDKERYNKEMVDYKNSNAYKQYLKDNSLGKVNKNGEIETNSHHNEPAAQQSISSTTNVTNGEGPNLNWLQQETNIAGFDVPIFTEEFIEYSKGREQEMRQLRKDIAEMEKQNSVLHNHIENIKQSTNKIESDIERFKNSNNQMQKNADLFRQTILHCFNNIALPNTQEYPTPNNIDDYIMKTYAILNATMQSENSNESAYSLNRQFANHVKSVFSKINFSSLFESV